MDVLTNWKVANMAIDIKNDYNNWIEIMERYPRKKIYISYTSGYPKGI